MLGMARLIKVVIELKFLFFTKGVVWDRIIFGCFWGWWAWINGNRWSTAYFLRSHLIASASDISLVINAEFYSWNDFILFVLFFYSSAITFFSSCSLFPLFFIIFPRQVCCWYCSLSSVNLSQNYHFSLLIPCYDIKCA